MHVLVWSVVGKISKLSLWHYIMNGD